MWERLKSHWFLKIENVSQRRVFEVSYGLYGNVKSNLKNTVFFLTKYEFHPIYFSGKF
jgi:hypothetical protein